MIQALHLPKAALKLTRKQDVVYVWCIIRKKNLVCTPEEWVRQHLIHYLIHEKQVPQGLIASEYKLTYNGLSKRADIVLFKRSGAVAMIIECKAPSVAIDNTTFLQIAQYNAQLNPDYLMLSNGLDHFLGAVDKEKGKVTTLDDFPEIDFT